MKRKNWVPEWMSVYHTARPMSSSMACHIPVSCVQYTPSAFTNDRVQPVSKLHAKRIYTKNVYTYDTKKHFYSLHRRHTKHRARFVNTTHCCASAPAPRNELKQPMWREREKKEERNFTVTRDPVTYFLIEIQIRDARTSAHTEWQTIYRNVIHTPTQRQNEKQRLKRQAYIHSRTHRQILDTCTSVCVCSH